MAEVDTPKRQREAVLTQHKENFKEMDATETQRMARTQKEVLDREVKISQNLTEKKNSKS